MPSSGFGQALTPAPWTAPGTGPDALTTGDPVGWSLHQQIDHVADHVVGPSHPASTWRTGGQPTGRANDQGSVNTRLIPVAAPA